MPSLTVPEPIDARLDHHGRRKNHPHIAICIHMNAKGHIQPTVVLAKRLVMLGASVTLICPERSLISVLGRDPTLGFDIQLRFLSDSPPISPNSPLPVSSPSPRTVMKGVRRAHYTVDDLQKQSQDGAGSFMIQNEREMQEKLENLLVRMQRSPSPVAGMIVDMLFPWAHPVLRKLQIPNFALFTAAATHLTLSHSAKRLYEEGVLPISSSNSSSMISLPGMPPLRAQDIPDLIRDPAHPFFSLDWHEYMFDSQGVLINTALEIEGKVIDALRMDPRMSKTRLIPIGPLLPVCFFLDDHESKSRSAAPLNDVILDSPKPQEARCKAFLDLQPPRSVVYVSFGSMALLDEEQIMELAVALDSCGHGFLWVLPIPPSCSPRDYMNRVLPPDFERKIKGRGLLVEDWAPQHLVLKHPALGGFVTHCGWNSVQECISLAGAPMLGWPFTNDQPVNCRFLAEELKIAVEMEGADRILERGDIERAIRRLMEGAEAEQMRARAQKLKSDIRRTILDESGSSQVNLRQLVEDLARHNDPAATAAAA